MNILSLVLQLCVLFIVIAVERTIGVPMVSLLLIAVGSTQHKRVLRYVWLICAALFIQALFMIPWTMSMILIVLVYLVWEYGRTFVSSETLRLLAGSGLAATCVALLAPGAIDSTAIAYALFVGVGLLLILKRERLQPKQWRRFG
jgi:hypothetical protein